MKRRVSVGVSLAALMMVLAQAQASAHTRASSKHKARRSQASAGRSRRAVVKTLQRHFERSLSRLRERARQYEPFIQQAALKYRVDPFALWVIAYNETRFRPGLRSPTGAEGLMQFEPQTAQQFGLKDPYDAPAAIEAAARYVRQSAAQFGNRLDLILASYNAGPQAVEAYLKGIRIVCRNGRVINPRAIKTGGVPPYSETRKYVGTGLRVYTRVRAAAVFPAEVTARTPLVTLPEPAEAQTLTSAYPLNDRELDDLGAARPVLQTASLMKPPLVTLLRESGTVLDSAATTRQTAATPPQESAQIEEVFFDIHSGVRYLVRQGEIVKQLEAVTPSEQSAVQPATVEKNRSVVARSSFYGTARRVSE